MNDKPKSTAQSASEASASKRPHAALDLKATEIKVTPVAAAASSSASAKVEAIKTPLPAPASSYAETAKASAPEAKPSTSASAAASTSKPAGEPPKSTAAPAYGGSADKVVAQKRGAVFTHLAAGLAGGLLALGAYQWLEPRLQPSEQQTSTLASRLSALEQSKPVAAASAEIETRIAELEKSVAVIPDLKSAQAQLVADTKAALAGAASDAGAPEQVTRLAALEDRFKALADAGANDPNAGRLEQLAALTGKISDLETSLATQLTALRESVAKDVEGRMQTATEASEAAKAGAQRVDRDVAAIKSETIQTEERLRGLREDIERASARIRAAVDNSDAVRAEISSVKSSVAKPADVAAAVEPIAGQVAVLNEQIKSLANAEAGRRADSERVVLALELQTLKRALDSGRPYEAELESVAKTAGGEVDVAALDKFKATGVPPAADLSKEFRSVANAAIDAEAEPAEGGVVERLIAGAKSVVRVRKTDQAADDKSTEAIVARIEHALTENRLEDALTEASQLPPKAQAAAKPFLDKVAARVAVERAVAGLEAKLKSSLGAAAPVKTQ